MQSCEAPHHEPLYPTVMKHKAIRNRMSDITINRREVILLMQKTLQVYGMRDLADELGRRELGPSQHDGGHRLLELIKENNITAAIDNASTLLANESPDEVQKVINLLIRFRYRSIVEEGNQIEALRFIRQHIDNSGLDKNEAFHSIL